MILVAGREDSSKVRKQEQECMRFSSAWMKEGSNLLQKAPFSLSKKVIVLVDERAESVRTPAGFDWRPHSLFGNPTGMKSHKWKEVSTSRILKFCLRGMLGSNQRHSLYKLYDVMKFDVITDLCSEDVDNRRMDELESNVLYTRHLCAWNETSLYPCGSLSFTFYITFQCLSVDLAQFTGSGCILSNASIHGLQEE